MGTQAEYKASSQPIYIDEVLEKINEIAKVSVTGDYIYRGEPAHHVAVVQYKRKVDRKARR